MQKIGDDKIVYNTIEEILDPSRAALVVWDVQHGTTKVIFNKEEFSRNLNLVVELDANRTFRYSLHKFKCYQNDLNLHQLYTL